MHERIFRLTEVNQSQTPSGSFRVATKDDMRLLAQWTLAFHHEAVPNDPLFDVQGVTKRRTAYKAIFIWDDGIPVSVAATSHPTTNGVSVNFGLHPTRVSRERVCHRVCGKLEPASSRFRFFVRPPLRRSCKSDIKPSLQEDRLSPYLRLCRVAPCRRVTVGRPWNTGRNTKKPRSDTNGSVFRHFSCLLLFFEFLREAQVSSLARLLHSLKPRRSPRGTAQYHSCSWFVLHFISFS